jgi:hypothetical protein
MLGPASGSEASPVFSATFSTIESIESVERVVVVDLRGFPLLRFIPLDSKSLLKLIRRGKLTTNGISPGRFDSWLAESFDIDVCPLELTSEASRFNECS